MEWIPAELSAAGPRKQVLPPAIVDDVGGVDPERHAREDPVRGAHDPGVQQRLPAALGERLLLGGAPRGAGVDRDLHVDGRAPLWGRGLGEGGGEPRAVENHIGIREVDPVLVGADLPVDAEVHVDHGDVAQRARLLHQRSRNPVRDREQARQRHGRDQAVVADPLAGLQDGSALLRVDPHDLGPAAQVADVRGERVGEDVDAPLLRIEKGGVVTERLARDTQRPVHDVGQRRSRDRPGDPVRRDLGEVGASQSFSLYGIMK